MARRLGLCLLVGLWIGLLTLPLNVRTEKRDRDLVRFEPHLDRSLWIALGVAGLGVLGVLLSEVRKTAPSRAAGARFTRGGDVVAGWMSSHRGFRIGASALVLAAAAALPFNGN